MASTLPSQYDLFNPDSIIGESCVITHLACRMSHKTVPEPPAQPPNLDIREFLSLSPNRITRYARNIAPDTRDYTYDLISRGGILLPDGSIDMTNVRKTLTASTKHNGIISTKANRNVQNSIDWMVLLATNKDAINPKWNSHYRWKLNFITLSLSGIQRHSDKYLMKHLLQPFLDFVRKSFNPKFYFWRAETQANGRIHWHICFDVFIPWQVIKHKWNALLCKQGYTSDYYRQFNHHQPNSTDIHSLKKVKKAAAYLSKYCGKNSKGVIILASKALPGDHNFPFLHMNFKWKYPKKNTSYFRQVYCKLWGCSENLSKLRKCKVMLNDALLKDLMKFQSAYPHRVIDNDYCRSYYIDCTELVGLGLYEIRNVLKLHVLQALQAPQVNN